MKAIKKINKSLEYPIGEKIVNTLSGKGKSNLKQSDKNVIKAFCFAVPIMAFLWFYLKLYILFGIKSIEWIVGIYIFLVLLATGMWANMLNQADANKKIADSKRF